ncbi:hypothetical protein BGX29_007884 [Mortierella sp. GBA35]|nr:hypothetical protein BGX23_010448 [Mortierella sp. AD031]KAF9097837.1 hypothetical protein BGX29_007884 [Mortierella sp. GBA35]KAG0204679.1 hypothetical protein BGX33_008358 [Mortierella sp. NVP41]
MNINSKVVFVGNIPYEQTEEQLTEIFSEVGPVVSFRLVFDRDTGKPRGYGFCEFHDERTAASAVRNLNGRDIGNRSLKVDFADTDPAKEEGVFMRPGGLAGPPPPGPPPPGMPPHLQQQQQQQQQGPPQGQRFMPPGGGPPPQPPRMDPRLGGNPNAPPMPPQPLNRPQPPQPSMAGGPPAPAAPKAPGISSADAISAVLATMTPQNVFDLISSMKVLGASEPERAKAVLNDNPQLSYALFQALLMMNLVEPSSLQRMFGPNAAAAPSMSTPPQQHMPPVPPSHPGMVPPPQPPHLQQQQQPPQFAPQGYPGMVQAPQPPQPQPPQLVAAPTSLEQQKALIDQVLALTPADIASLPEDQRANIIQFRAQLMRGGAV